MPFEDPAKAAGSDDERRDQIRRIRDQIKAWLSDPPADSSFNKNIIRS